MPYGWAPNTPQSEYMASAVGSGNIIDQRDGTSKVTFSSVPYGKIQIGQGLYYGGRALGNIIRQVSGTPNGAGDYLLDISYTSVGGIGTCMMWPRSCQPDFSGFSARVVGTIISNGDGTSTLDVKSVLRGSVQLGQLPYVDNTIRTVNGVSNNGVHYLSAFRTGTGGTGTYILNWDVGASSYSGRMWLNLVPQVGAGQLIAIDADHHVCLTSPGCILSTPIYTNNATSSSCTWQPCRQASDGSQMPSQRFWFANSITSGYAFGTVLAVDFVDKGTVYLMQRSASPMNLWRSDDYGATWYISGTCPVLDGIHREISIRSVPKNAGHIFACATGQAALYRSMDHGASWASMNIPTLPAGVSTVISMAIGAPSTLGGYPTLYVVFGFPMIPPSKNAHCYIYQCRNGDQALLNWEQFPEPTTYSFPKVQQINNFNFSSLQADPEIYQRLYVPIQGGGFVYYNP